jgi:hypothetical protein
MPMTRAQVEQWTVQQLTKWLTKVGMSTLINGANPDLAAPIAGALRVFGYAVANPISPSDSDLALVPDVPPTNLEGVLQAVRIETLRAILTAWDRVDEKEGLDEAKYDQFAKRVQTQIDSTQARLTNEFGLGRRRTKMVAGSIFVGSKWPPTPPPPMNFEGGNWPPVVASDEVPPASGRFNP